MSDYKKYIRLTDWNKYHDWPKVSGIRWLIHKNTKDFHKVLRKVGGVILIDEGAFFEWVDKQTWPVESNCRVKGKKGDINND